MGADSLKHAYAYVAVKKSIIKSYRAWIIGETNTPHTNGENTNVTQEVCKIPGVLTC